MGVKVLQVFSSVKYVKKVLEKEILRAPKM
jgi:hypothetical protein